ncbi:B3 domain-containing protein At2g33720-like [Telopea speciosissima]|uniref:B3 domain-containing protein At2g33720-like n=1 Tax=Telopea speciosissima TaxID=54955 RepID=UPI001CC712B3|nr:B3 domain-containing protein At2g33720-like [Telopea speciosissima]
MKVLKKRRDGEEQKEEDPLELKLYRDPWIVKKNLTASDLYHLSRIILPSDQVEKHVLPFLNPCEIHGVVQSFRGLNVWVYDLDTGTRHLLSFKKWNSNHSYKLGLNWIKEFVKRRELRTGDLIGMLWDPSTRGFCFSVLKRSPLPPDGAAAAEPVVAVVATATPPPPDPKLCEFARKRLRLSPPVPDNDDPI